jgi:hypothetical protein
VQVIARRRGGSGICLRRDEKVSRLALEPGPDPQLGVPVAGGDVDVVDSVTEQHLERAIGDLLGRPRQRRRAKQGAGALVSGAPEIGDWYRHLNKVFQPAVPSLNGPRTGDVYLQP